MPKLLYQGHGSYRLTANDGRTIYVDPYAGKNYDTHADIIIHLQPGALFNRKKAEKRDAPNKLILEPEQEIAL